jgi:hypothetical protein
MKRTQISTAQARAFGERIGPPLRHFGVRFTIRWLMVTTDPSKPFRVASGTDTGHHQEESPERSRWSRFPDPDLASRIFAELEQRIGAPPEGADARAREAWEKKVNSAVQLVSRKHHLKPRDVKAIWLAGNEEDPSHAP